MTLTRAPFAVVVVALALLAVTVPSSAAENLLKNGSFEGGRRYWFEADHPGRSVVDGDAAHGVRALRVDKGDVQSAAILLEQGRPVTLSFSARAAAGDAATMGWQITPASREQGQKFGLTWGLRGKNPVKLTGRWQRFSFTFTPNVPQTGLWPRPTFMLQIGDAKEPILLDAVTVAYDAGKDAYVPRRPVEVGVESPSLKGYKVDGNLLTKGQDVTLVGHVNNAAGDAARDVTLRWQFIDYEGAKPLSEPIEKRVTVPPGKTLSETVTTKLSPNGLVLARFSAIAADGSVIDSSDLPLASLPYPKAATNPDWRERFGGSLWGKHVTGLQQQIGMAWTRWWPHMNWADHQKEGPDGWHWFDKELDVLQSKGHSTHAVLYGKPKWAFSHKDDVLPKDMQWAPADPRWEDLSVQTAWDKFVIAAVNHYKGRSLVYEIENEPELDDWDKTPERKDQYARFTLRTARLIKQTDAAAKVMVDNVYGVPSGINRHMLEYARAKGWQKWIDIISWHDYHEGWLADGVAMRRMRNNLADLDCGHIEIWFNEGWAYTNTVVDEPGGPALTNLTAAQSTNAMVDSVAELTANGQEKTILFHTGYETHGMSFWDYYGPGTMLWDYYDYPTPLVAAWNVLAHHVGLSDEVGQVRPEGANFCVFDDLRNARGVMVAYADRDVKSDVTVELPIPGLTAEDAMGNPVSLADGRKLTLSKSGRPVFLYDAAGKTPGKVMFDKLAPLDRKNAGFVTTAGTGAAGKSWKLPPAWEGTAAGKSDGNPAVADGKPVWRLDQVWPPEPMNPASYRPMVWKDGWWRAPADDFGGQPKAEQKDTAIRLEFRAKHGNPAAERLSALSFVAPEAGTFRLTGTAALTRWENASNAVKLHVLKKTRSAVEAVATLPLQKGDTPLADVSVDLAAGDELVLVPRMDGMFSGGDVLLKDLRVSTGGAATDAPAGAVVYRLPRAWEGVTKGSAENNPIKAGGKPLWRIDQVYPFEPMMADRYTPVPWSGTAWHPEKTQMGGQPSATVEDGTFKTAARGPWGGGGENEIPRVTGLVFMTPESGLYRVRGTASAKPWAGDAKTYKLGVLKKDTQRATEEKVLELPRDATKVPLDFTIDLTAGHELVFLPLMKGQYNNALNVTIEDLRIERQ